MNWDLIKWFAGVLLTMAGIRFVWVMFRTLLSKETMKDAVSAIGGKINDASRETAEFIRKKADERKKAKNQPMITIR